MRRAAIKILPSSVLLATGAYAVGCAGGGAGYVKPPPPPPPSIQVSVSPATASVILGNTQKFAAKVTNTSDTVVKWSVNGISGGDSIVGNISADGTYTAPTDLPSPVSVTVTATSHANAAKSGSAGVTIVSDITMTLTPGSANVELGATWGFQATVSSAGHPDSMVRWSLSSAACASGCGIVDGNGNYTAPQILPSPASVTLTAASAADPSKKISAAITIVSNFTLQLSAPPSVPTGGTATLVATLTAVAGSNPSTVMSWTLTGAGCSGATCGTLNVAPAQPTGGNVMSQSATYTAPNSAPQPNSVTISVTPQADASRKAQASITILAGTVVSLSPASATRAANHRVTLTARVNGTANTNVSWSVNGIAGGNATVGKICAVASNPCQTLLSGNAGPADYLAPGSIPSANPVTVQVTSAADATKTAAAQITIINHVLVSVLPSNATLAPLAVQGFTASVLGTDNQNVVWQIQGAGCTGGGVCGSIAASGAYSAPAAAPTPDALQVMAISADDVAQSGFANVSITTGASILSLHPASVYAGGADGFTLRVDGTGYVASNPGPGSALLIGGSARTTSCNSANECTAPVSPADVAAAGSVTVQIQNPDRSVSNVVSLVVVMPEFTDEVISLTAGSPAANGKDIVVVEPTTAGLDVGGSLDLDIGALGTFLTASNTCNLGGNPIPLQRPASGLAAADVCIFSQSGLDTCMTYTVSGPGDVTVISKQPAGLGIIHLTLQVAATATPGARTIFIQNRNLDKTAASGVLEIE